MSAGSRAVLVRARVGIERESYLRGHHILARRTGPALAAGELDAALEWYTKAFDAHKGILVIAIVDPVTAVLRTDQRFAPLIARMKRPWAVASRRLGGTPVPKTDADDDSS